MLYLDYAIEILQKEKNKQIQGLIYIEQSPLIAEEETVAQGLVKSKIRKLNKAIDALTFFSKFL